MPPDDIVNASDVEDDEEAMPPSVSNFCYAYHVSVAGMRCQVRASISASVPHSCRSFQGHLRAALARGALQPPGAAEAARGPPPWGQVTARSRTAARCGEGFNITRTGS